MAVLEVQCFEDDCDNCQNALSADTRSCEKCFVDGTFTPVWGCEEHPNPPICSLCQGFLCVHHFLQCIEDDDGGLVCSLCWKPLTRLVTSLAHSMEHQIQ